MNRIILGLAVSNYALVAITAYLGLLTVPRDALTRGQDYFHVHFAMAMTTALYTIFVHCLVFTYFLGTGRWVREAAAAYSLDGSLSAKSHACRLRAFGLALSSILLVVAAIASGAWTDTADPAWKDWSLMLHRILPAGTYLFMILAYRIQYRAVVEHIGLTELVMSDVERIRRQRGLAPLGRAKD